VIKVDKMKRISIVWGIMVVLIVGMLTVFGFFYKSKTTIYDELEEKLVDASKKYVDANFLYPQDKDELKVTKEELVDNQYLDELKKDDNDCSGYVIVKLSNGVYTYKAYIKCPNYKTKGYK
jgi:uncharacterized protein YpmB